MKKYLAMALAAVMLFGATACSSGSKDTQGSSDNKEQQGTESDAQGEAGDATFTIGFLGPLTGSVASYGLSVKQGAEIAIQEINEAGGVKAGDTTYTLKMVAADDEGSEDKAITAYNNLMDQNINVLMGAVTSGPCIAITSQTYADGILQITPSGSAIPCTEYDNAFRICFTDPLQGVTMANFAKDELGLSKVAIIFCNSDEYSTGMKDAFIEQANEIGLEIVASEAFNDGDVDFGTQLTTIKATEAEAIFCPIYYEAAAYLTQQARDMGIELPFIGGDGWDGVLAQVTDPSTVEGAIFLSPFLASDPKNESFVSQYEAAYGATPDQFAADGYDAVYTFKADLEKAGTTDNEALIAAMTGIEVQGLTGTFTFTADGEPEKAANFIVIKDGAYTAY